ncbi:IclR family transcriptional regulator [Bradyrhizobium sp. CCGUVB14]|uniref:IclR family transcriptional regulator n=1 Tax=Bradyrhizobium sp. CCGUVB14 TaxID=2949628 RepID=UPI0020B25651|nr:IclR family transcriptional regulator [Bradyrhizobium sp. CCGUVB14]MCP3446106.1 IclR family transcriptional regulator [Bradyrhizobium sp. CCGUVB14]
MAKKRKTAASESDTGMSSVRAVDRAIAILQCFSADQPAMSVIEIQKRVGLSRPTLYRLLHTLSTCGLIHAEGDPQRFKLAHGVMKLSHVWLKGLDVVNVARPILEELRDVTGETAALFRLEEDRSICILECESRHVLTISRGIGSSMKIPQGATGKAMLAFMPAERQAEFLSEMPRDAQRSNLEEALRAAAHNGYTISRGEIFVGAIAVAAPYFDHRGSVVGSVGLYGPAARVSEEKISEFARLIREAGHKISTLLGFQQPASSAIAQDSKSADLAPMKRPRKAAKV